MTNPGIPTPLMLALLALGLSVAVPNLVNLIRRRSTSPSEVNHPSYQELNAERKALEQCEQKLLESEWSRKKAEATVALLTPLQWECLKVGMKADEIAASHPRPSINLRDFGSDAEGRFADPAQLTAFKRTEDAELYKWRTIVRSNFVLNLQEQAKTLYHRLVSEKNCTDHHLASLVDSADTAEALSDLATTLRKVAFEPGAQHR